MKHIFSIGFLYFFYGCLTAQITIYPTVRDTIYLKERQNGDLKITEPSTADVKIITYSEKGLVFEKKVINHRTNQLREHRFYNEGKPSGKWLYFNEVGEVIWERNFGKLVYGDCTSSKPPSSDILLPKYGYGEDDLKRYIKRELRHPAASRRADVFGLVKISFVVDVTGRAKVSHICGEGLDAYCDLEVWEIIEKMPRWTPGSQNGKLVEVSYILPVEFSR